MKCFKEYIITEALKPIKTNYGWFQDHAFVDNLVDENPKVLRTLFPYGGEYYAVFFEIKTDVELGFFKVSDVDSLALGMFDSSYTKSNSNKISMGIFNRVIYVALELMKIYEIEEFSYHAPEQNLELDDFYNNINSNKQFISVLNSMGLTVNKSRMNIGDRSV